MKKDWVRQWVPPPRHTEAGGRECLSQPTTVSRRILGVVLSSRFRKGSFEAMRGEDFISRHLDLVTCRVRRGQPLLITLIGFPFKAPNPLKVGARTLPDLAEVGALAALARIHRAVQDVYPPGLEIVIIHDGTYIADALDVPLAEARTYAEYFGWLVRATGTDAFVRGADLAELMFVHGPRRGGWEEVGKVRAPPGIVPYETRSLAFRKTLGMLNVRSIPAGTLSAAYRATLSGDSDSLRGEAAALPTRAWRAMEQYEICDTLLHRFDPRPRAFPEAIHATTRSQPGRLALWLVRRGRSLLPWQGVGVVRGERVEVREAVDIQESSAYRPVFLEGEATPFCYEPVPDRGHDGL